MRGLRSIARGALWLTLIVGCASRSTPEPATPATPTQRDPRAAEATALRSLSTHGVEGPPRLAITESPEGGATLNVYFGNLHSHTSYSDGSGTPEDAFTTARGAGLHFLAVTEHNHRLAENGAGERRDGRLIATDHALYRGAPHSLVETARRLSVDGEFVAVYGQEWSSISSGNHVNVFAIDDVIDDSEVRNGDFAGLVRWLEQREDGHPTLMQFNHPADYREAWREYGRDDFQSVEAWLQALDGRVQLIELLNGPAMARDGGHQPADVMEGDYREYLNLGFHIAPTADQDNHYYTWGITTEARTGVLAPELTPGSLLSSLAARHVFASEDRNLAGVLWASGVLMGGEAPCANEATIPVHVQIIDADEPDAAYRVTIFSDAGPGGAEAEVIEELDATGTTTAQLVADIARPGADGYVFARITQYGEHDRDRLWTAPVWFQACGDAPSTSTSGLVIAAVLPDPEGSDEQNERVRLRNTGATRVDIRGWRVRDRTGRYWALEGRIAAGGEREVVRNGQRMSLNNTGGELVELVDPSGVVVDSLSYHAAEVGMWIER